MDPDPAPTCHRVFASFNTHQHGHRTLLEIHLSVPPVTGMCEFYPVKDGVTDLGTVLRLVRFSMILAVSSRLYWALSVVRSPGFENVDGCWLFGG